MQKDWRKQHWEELKQLAGNWIGIDDESGNILAFDAQLSLLVVRLRESGKPYTLHFVNPLDVYEPRKARFVNFLV